MTTTTYGADHTAQLVVDPHKDFTSGDLNHCRFEPIMGYRLALESAYREIAELKDKLAKESFTWKRRSAAGWILEASWGRV